MNWIKNVARRQIELECSLLTEICIGLVTALSMPCLSPVAPRKLEAQTEKGASDVDQRWEMGPSGGNSVREVKMPWQWLRLGLRRHTRVSRLVQGNRLFFKQLWLLEKIFFTEPHVYLLWMSTCNSCGSPFRCHTMDLLTSVQLGFLCIWKQLLPLGSIWV